MYFSYKIKFDILISTKTLFHIKASFNVPVRNEIIPQSKICKIVMKQKFKHYFLLTLLENSKFLHIFLIC